MGPHVGIPIIFKEVRKDQSGDEERALLVDKVHFEDRKCNFSAMALQDSISVT